MDATRDLLSNGVCQDVLVAPREARECDLNAGVRSELIAALSIGLPLALSNAGKIVQDMSNTVILGRYDTAALAAVSVCSIWTSLCDVMFFNGLGQVSTLCSEADGAGNKALVGTWLQIFLVFTTIATIPVCALRFITAPLLKFVGIDHAMADLAGEYAIWSQFGFMFDMWYLSTKEYYASQRIVYPDVFVDGIFIFVNIGIVSYCVDNRGWGVIGAAVGTTVTRLLRTVVYVLFCWWKGYHKHTWNGWSCKEIFVRSRWWTLFALVIPAAIGGLVEELQFEFCMILAGRIGEVEAAVMSFAVSIFMLSCLMSMALGDATGMRMARLLGAQRIEAAKLVTKIGILMGVGINLVVGALIVLFIGSFGRMASSDERVQTTLHDLRWPIGIAVAALGGFFPLASILSKSGRAGVLGIIVGVCCWVVGCPISFWSSRTTGIYGIIDGLVVGYLLAWLALLIVYVRSDWERLAAESQVRAEVENQVPAQLDMAVVTDAMS
eukprot:TRINITY_DN13993_c1_g4_i1.p1 TRINITY_DN13993_c1_g4~~TRINITY_DN13993_c1_g4_i1.p1  ORF type:complete len:546 (+),score=68.26 TRINITY_DN13993_c1_g4_i1:155-1639(+)